MGTPSKYSSEVRERVNHARLLAPIGYVPPAEYEAAYSSQGQ